jgi:hypothetical protein
MIFPKLTDAIILRPKTKAQIIQSVMRLKPEEAETSRALLDENDFLMDEDEQANDAQLLAST